MSAWDKLSMFERADIMKLAVENGVYNLDAIRNGYNKFAEGGGIHIDPSKKGTFTAAASKHDMGVQEFASRVLANKEDYSSAMVRKANFARNSKKWKHGEGGNLFSGEEKHSQQITTKSKQAPWYSELGEAVLGEVMQQLRNIAYPGNSKEVSYKGDVRGKNGGTAQRTYLLPRSEQEDIFLRDGYIKGKEGDYGLVKKAVNNRNLPVWQTKPDAVSRKTLVPIGNTYGMDSYGYIGLDKDLVHAESHPAAFYIDGSTGKLYTKGWDLNDYGGTGGGRSSNYRFLKKAGADILDFIGNPVVVTTGFQEVTNPWGGASSHFSRGATIQTLFDHDYYGASTVGKMLDNAMSKKGLHREHVEDKWLYALPEITVTGKKNGWKHAFGGNLFDGTSQPTQQMQLGSAYWKQQARKPIFTKELAEFNKRKAEEGRQRREEFKKWATTKGKELVEKSQKDYLTTSNDNTWVENRNPTVKASKPKNPHLTERSVKGAKAHAAWEKEHPVLNTWENVLGAVPFAVAAAPLAAAAGSGIAALGDAAAATSAGQAAIAGLTPLTTAASTSVAGAPLYTWADAGLSSLFGAHGIQTAIDEGGISPTTALEIAPLGRLAKPMFNETAMAIKNYRYPLGRPQIPNDYLTIKPQVRTRVGDVEIGTPNMAYRQGNDLGRTYQKYKDVDASVAQHQIEDNIEQSLSSRNGKPYISREEALDKAIANGTFDPAIGIEVDGHPAAYQDTPMYSDGFLWYGTPKIDETLPLGSAQSGLLVTPRNDAFIIGSNKATPYRGTGSGILRSNGVTTVTDNGGRLIPADADNLGLELNNISAYNWEPGYGYRKVFAEETPAAEWPMGRIAPEITAENATNITPTSREVNQMMFPSLDIDGLKRAIEQQTAENQWKGLIRGEEDVFNYLGSKKHINRIMDSGVPRERATKIAQDMRDNAMATDRAIDYTGGEGIYHNVGEYDNGFFNHHRRTLHPKYTVMKGLDEQSTYENVIHELGGHGATLGYRPGSYSNINEKAAKWYEDAMTEWSPYHKEVYEHNSSLKPIRKPEYANVKDPHIEYLEGVDEYSARARAANIDNSNRQDFSELYKYFTKESVDKLKNSVWGLIPFGIGLTGYELFNNQEALGGKIKKRKR